MDRFVVGNPLSPIDLQDLPTGAVIGTRMDSGTQFQRDEDGLYTAISHSGSRRHTPDAFGSGYRLVRLPDGYVQHTLTNSQYRWRFRNLTVAAARSHAVTFDPVLAALEEMGAGLASLPLEVGTRVGDRNDLPSLPVGTLVQNGRVEDYNSLGIFEVQANTATLRRVFGGMTRPDPGVVVVRLPEGYVPPVTDESEEALNAFKVRAYLIGMKLKFAQGWCSTYEAVVRPLGISADQCAPLIQDNDLIGTKVNPDGAVALPVGSVLYWRNSAGDACSWFMRVEEAGNRAGTRRIFTHNEGERAGRPGHFADRMMVAFVPSTAPGMGMLARMPDLNVAAHWSHLPPGTILAFRDESYYIICADRRATTITYNPDGAYPRTPARGDYTLTSFSMPQELRVVRFPMAVAE